MQSVLANLSGKGSEHLKVSLLLQIHNLGGFKNQSVNGTLPLALQDASYGVFLKDQK